MTPNILDGKYSSKKFFYTFPIALNMGQYFHKVKKFQPKKIRTTMMMKVMLISRIHLVFTSDNDEDDDVVDDDNDDDIDADPPIHVALPPI